MKQLVSKKVKPSKREKKRYILFRFSAAKPISFKEELDTSIQGVEVTKILEDNEEPKRIYDPSHPDAGDDGYVEMPNISVIKEMVDMMSATRSYEANTTVIKSAKRMALKALEIGR